MFVWWKMLNTSSCARVLKFWNRREFGSFNGKRKWVNSLFKSWLIAALSAESCPDDAVSARNLPISVAVNQVSIACSKNSKFWRIWKEKKWCGSFESLEQYLKYIRINDFTGLSGDPRYEREGLSPQNRSVSVWSKWPEELEAFSIKNNNYSRLKNMIIYFPRSDSFSCKLKRVSVETQWLFYCSSCFRPTVFLWDRDRDRL